jgi:chondroitin AC lyase
MKIPLLLLLMTIPPAAVAAAHVLQSEPVRQSRAADTRDRIELLDLDSVVLIPGSDATDARLIKERLRKLYLSADPPPPQQVDEWLAALRPDGSWEEFDYRTFHTRFFPPFEHLRRVTGMALAYLKGEKRRGDPALLDAVARAIAFWVEAKPQTRHLWFIEIGVPLQLVRPLVLLEGELDPALIRAAFPLLTHAVADDDYTYHNAPATGANLTWIARSAMEAALLVGDIPLAAQAARRMAGEIRVTLGEGIQPDFGYHQHGAQFYAGGYGASFIHDCAALVALLDGTRFAVDPERVALLVDYILEGPRWMTRHGEWVSGSRGREISRPGGRMSAAALERLLEVRELPRGAEVAAFAEELRAERGAVRPAIAGNRHFWSVDLMVQHQPAWSAFIDLTSERIFGTEGGNNENLLGYHLVDGVVEIMRAGDEYHNIAPLWDWKKIPGATIRQYPGEIPFIDWWGDMTRGSGAFTGGLSDNRRGLAALDADRHGVGVNKVWSVSENWILAAGFAPRVAAGNRDPVVTTLDQRRLRGKALVQREGCEAVAAGRGETRLAGPVWVRHDNMAWFIPEGQAGTLLIEHRREPWWRVNRSGTDSGRFEEGDIFTLWIDHGAQPVAQFHYIVWPGIAIDGPLPALEQHPRVHWKDAELLIVEDGSAGVRQVAAFAAGEWAIDGGSLSVSHPCLLQLLVEGDAAVLTVADPAREVERLALRLPAGWLPERLRPLAGGVLYLDLPREASAGNSVRLPLAPGMVP